MVNIMIKLLKDLEIDETKIETERFMGY